MKVLIVDDNVIYRKILTRAIKDLFPRYQSMCGKRVLRKGGWDTHGLPVEVEVEKEVEAAPPEAPGENVSSDDAAARPLQAGHSLWWTASYWLLPEPTNSSSSPGTCGIVGTEAYPC